MCEGATIRSPRLAWLLTSCIGLPAALAGCVDATDLPVPAFHVGDVAVYEENSTTRGPRHASDFPANEWVRLEIAGHSRFVDRYLRERTAFLVTETRAMSADALDNSPRLVTTYFVDASTSQVGGARYGAPAGVDLSGQWVDYWTAETWWAYGGALLANRTLREGDTFTSLCAGPPRTPEPFRFHVDEVRAGFVTVTGLAESGATWSANYPPNLCQVRLRLSGSSPWPASARFTWTDPKTADHWVTTYDVHAELRHWTQGTGPALPTAQVPTPAASPFPIEETKGAIPGFDARLNATSLNDYLTWAQSHDDETKAFWARNPTAHVVEGALRVEEASEACGPASELPGARCRRQSASLAFHAPAEDLTISIARTFRVRDDGTKLTERYDAGHVRARVPLVYEPSTIQPTAIQINLSDLPAPLRFAGLDLESFEVRQQALWPPGLFGFDERMVFILTWSDPTADPQSIDPYLRLDSKTGVLETAGLLANQLAPTAVGG